MSVVSAVPNHRPVFGQPLPRYWTVRGIVFVHCKLWDRISEMVKGDGDEEPDEDDVMEGLRDAGHAFQQRHAVRDEVAAMSREEAMWAAEREARQEHGCAEECKECGVDWVGTPEAT
jgi:hypothetical protein